MLQGETLSIRMARQTYLMILILGCASCLGLQRVDRSTPANPLPELQSYPLPDRPISSLDELETQPVALAYSVEFESIDSKVLRSILQQRVYGWIRSLDIRGKRLAIFRIKPDESAPEGYPYTLRVHFKAADSEKTYEMVARMDYGNSGRSYEAFNRNFRMEETGDDEAGLTLFSGLSLFLTDGSEPYIEFPEDTGPEFTKWLQRLGTGSVRILSGQEANVLVRNRQGQTVHRGATPVDLNLVAGAYEFDIKRKGMEPRHRTLIVRPAAKNVILLTWPDENSSSSLSVLTSPEGLQVAAEGTVQGESPLALPAVMAGDSSVEISKKEEGSSDAYILRQSNVSLGEGEDVTRFYPFSYYVDFQSESDLSRFWKASQALKSVRQTGEVLQLKSVKKEEGLPAGIMSEPIEAMDQRIRITVLPGKTLLLGLSSGQGTDRPFLKVQTDQIQFNPPASNSEAQPVTFVRPKAGEGMLDLVELQYDEEDQSILIQFNGKTVYQGPYQCNGYFQIYLSGEDGVPVQEMEILGGPLLGNYYLSRGSAFFYNLGRSLGLNPRIKALPAQGEGN